MSLSEIYNEEDEKHIFSEKLFLKLELESDGTKKEVPASHIERYEFELHSYGFKGMITFRGFDNPDLEKLFNSKKKMDVTFQYQTEVLTLEKKEPVKIQGIGLPIASKGIEKRKVEVREYTLLIVDPAYESWSHHFPKAVHIEKTMKDVIDAEKNSLIQIEYDWDTLNEEHPILAYDLGDSSHKRDEKQASFYSFIHWYLEEKGGIFEYQFKENKYKIKGKKESEGEPTAIAEWWVTSPISVFPSIQRWADNGLQVFPDKMEEKPTENDKGYDGVRKDWMEGDNGVVLPELQGRKTLSPINPQKGEATFWVKEFHEAFQCDTLFPGKLIQFKGRKKGNDHWCHHSLYKDKVYRLKMVHLIGSKKVDSQKMKVEVMPFLCTFKGVAEDKEETFISRPEYAVPTYPFYTPGEVFCDVGEEEQTTFNVKKGEKTSYRLYQIKVPLSKESEKYVICPYSPDTLPGHFYFPLYKKQQVLLALMFDSARVYRKLDHQPLTELAEDDQACQIVFASKGMHEFLVLKHEYEEGKNSVFTLKQSSSESQTQIFTLKEKETTICVEDQGKRKIFIHLHRDEGLKVEFQDQEGDATHSTLYSDKGITHTSKGGGKTSTIKQTPESVEFEVDKMQAKCKEFSVTAEKAVTLKADSKVLLDTPLAKATQEMTVG